MNFTFNKAVHPELEDDEYTYDLNDAFGVQVSHDDGQTYYIVTEHGGEAEDDTFWAKVHSEHTDLKAAQAEVVKRAGIEYALLRAISPEGQLCDMDVAGRIWEISIAWPKPGSNTEREMRDVFTSTDTEEAARHYTELLDGGLKGVIDSANVRIFDIASATELGDKLTDAVMDACDEIPEEDARDDDWDNTPVSELRDTVMDLLETRAEAQDAPEGPSA